MLLDDGISSSIVGLLSFWFSPQEMCVKWNGVISDCFSVGNGTRQGGVLSPYFLVDISEACYRVFRILTLVVILAVCQ